MQTSKSLDAILDIAKVKSLTAEEIRSLWIEYYSTKDAICAVIPSETYRSVQTTANQFPVVIMLEVYLFMYFLNIIEKKTQFLFTIW